MTTEVKAFKPQHIREIPRVLLKRFGGGREGWGGKWGRSGCASRFLKLSTCSDLIVKASSHDKLKSGKLCNVGNVFLHGKLPHNSNSFSGFFDLLKERKSGEPVKQRYTYGSCIRH